MFTRILPSTAAPSVERQPPTILVDPNKERLWLNSTLDRLNHQKARSLNTRKDRIDYLKELLSKAGTWTLCIFVPESVIPQSGIRLTKSPIPIEASVVYVDLLTENELVLFKLTPTTIESLVSAHQELLTKTSETFGFWYEHNVRMSFAQAANIFVYSGKETALQGLTEIGGGALPDDQCQTVQNQIRELFKHITSHWDNPAFITQEDHRYVPHNWDHSGGMLTSVSPHPIYDTGCIYEPWPPTQLADLGSSSYPPSVYTPLEYPSL